MVSSTQDSVVRSSKEIKARLLRNAWMTGAAADIISRIQYHHERSVSMPEGHGEALSNIVPGQDPALMRVNLRNYLAGYPCSFSSADGEKPPTVVAVLEPKRYEAHEIFEQIQAEEKDKAEKPDFLLEHGLLLLAESLDDAHSTGQIFYADDVSLSKHVARTNGELDYTGHTDIHAPYIDEVYQAQNETDKLSDIFDKAGGTILAESYYADDVYLAGKPEKVPGELDLTPHNDVQDAYMDDAYQAKSDGEALYEFMQSLADTAETERPSSAIAATTLSHAKTAEAHSPYIDAFFNASRWNKTVQDIAVDADTKKECDAMDRRATIKPTLIIQ